MRLGVVVNPVAGAGNGQKVGSEVLSTLLRTNHLVLDLSGITLEVAKSNIEAAIDKKEIDALILVGGDGMAHLAANVCALNEIVFAIVPAGTGNDAATVFGMPLNDTARCVELILAGLLTPKRIDAIELSHAGNTSWALGYASAGFDALVNARANKMSWPKGPNRYYLAMLLTLASFRPIRYSALLDKVPMEFEAMLCVVSNSGVFGGGMLVVPDASVVDGKLDVLIVKKMTRLKFLTVFPRVYKGTHVEDPDVEIIRAETFSIAANGMPIYSDGEYVGEAPFGAEVRKGALLAVAPSI